METADAMWTQVCRNCYEQFDVSTPVEGYEVAHACDAPRGTLGLTALGFSTRTTEYTLRVYSVDKYCAWRPDCTTCGEGGERCTWCTARGGFCDTAVNEERDVRPDPPPSPQPPRADEQVWRGQGVYEEAAQPLDNPQAGAQDACSQAIWCPEVDSTCASQTTCGGCSAQPNCGWCVTPEHPGVCTSGTDYGPTSGLCEFWSFRTGNCDGYVRRPQNRLGLPGLPAPAGPPPSPCGPPGGVVGRGCTRCAVHDAAQLDRCTACNAEPDCGFCYSFSSGVCLLGNATSSVDGACPGSKALWSFAGECDASGAEGSMATVVALDEQSHQQMKIGQNLLCALGPCMEAAFTVPLLESDILNVRASLAVLPADADVRFSLTDLLRQSALGAAPADSAMSVTAVASAGSGALDLQDNPASSFNRQSIMYSSCGQSLADASLLFRLTLESVQSREEVDAFFVPELLPSAIRVRAGGGGGGAAPSLGKQTWQLCCEQDLHLRVDTADVEASGDVGGGVTGELRLYLEHGPDRPAMLIFAKRAVCAYSYQKDHAFVLKTNRLFLDAQGTGFQGVPPAADELEYIALRWAPGGEAWFLTVRAPNADGASLVIRDAVFHPDGGGGGLPNWVWGAAGAGLGMLLGLAFLCWRRRRGGGGTDAKLRTEQSNGILQRSPRVTRAGDMMGVVNPSYGEAQQLESQQNLYRPRSRAKREAAAGLRELELHSRTLSRKPSRFSDVTEVRSAATLMLAWAARARWPEMPWAPAAGRRVVGAGRGGCAAIRSGMGGGGAGRECRAAGVGAGVPGWGAAGAAGGGGGAAAGSRAARGDAQGGEPLPGHGGHQPRGASVAH
eukprot:scaffold521_cov308-Prasinococcus_capsulatus_cf.AAC.6